MCCCQGALFFFPVRSSASEQNRMRIFLFFGNTPSKDEAAKAHYFVKIVSFYFGVAHHSNEPMMLQEQGAHIPEQI